MSGPTFDDLFRVMAAASVGDERARVALPAASPEEDVPTRFAIALNLLLDELTFRSAERRRAENAIRASEERYRTMFEQSPVPMIVYATEARTIADVNGAALHHYGYERDAFAQLRIDDVELPSGPDEAARAAGAAGEEARSARHRKRDGSIIDVEVREHDVALEGRPMRLLIAHDVTERRRLEEELRQAQKMEAVGRLAGGVAHDFNNLLSVIVGYGHSMMSALKDDDPMREDLAEVCRAGKRASELTRQLLTFSRQQVVEPTLLDLNDVLREMRRTLERAAGPDVRIVARSARPLGVVRADAVGIEQVIINLVVNARDAMSAGGVVTVETANVVLDEAYAHAHLGVTAGPHVMLAVRDEGVGMDAPTQARVFEPFFTTKPLGEGTGLGLSMVFGIVRQSGGSVRLESEPGKGAAFFLYFPRVEAPATRRRVPTPAGVPGGSETILVVEDDDQVRRMTRGILKRAGYDVLEARNGAEAITISEQHPGRIHLLVSDVMMPEIRGPDLARRLARARPDMRVLCVSGFTDDIVLEGEPGDVEISFLHKPLTPDALKRRVRELLDDDTPPSR